MACALFLQASSKVQDVLYPGEYNNLPLIIACIRSPVCLSHLLGGLIFHFHSMISWTPISLSYGAIGLPSHPGHAIAKAQSSGFSGMISFRISGGLTEATTFLKACQIFTLGESLGAVESLCEHPFVVLKSERRIVGKPKLEL